MWPNDWDRLKPSTKRLILWLIVFFFFGGLIARVAGFLALVLVLGLYFGLPCVLLWFVFHVFIRRLWRVHRIKAQRVDNPMLDAARRMHE